MKRFKLIVLYLLFAVSLFTISINRTSATGSASLYFTSNSKVYLGNDVSVSLYVDNISGCGNNMLGSIGGRLVFDTDRLQYSGVSYKYRDTTYVPSSQKLAYISYDTNRISKRTKLITFKFKAKSLGSTTIKFSEADISDFYADNVKTSSPSITINVIPKPSSNNYLSSLTTNRGNINFNKNTTSYSLNVASNITSINISATTEDNKSKISGTGTKSLGYGNNRFNITVTAENNSKRTYSINVNRKDNRNTNNNLKSLSVDGTNITPSFNKNELNYKVIIPFEIEKPNIKAYAEDKKARVSIANLTTIAPEESKDIKINVIAENQKVKTYTLTVVRGKDPNKPLSNNNDLEYIKVNKGYLSPAFDKKIKDYVVYLPYEIDNIIVDVKLSDTKYGLIEKNEPNSLKVGNNNFIYKVTAEDKSIREYTVNVIRNSQYSKEQTSALLKNITIKNGQLKETFNKNKFNYTFSKNDNYKVEYEKEYESSKVYKIEKDNNIYLVVISTNEEVNVYHLSLYKFNILYIIIPFILILNLLLYLFLMRKRISKKKK